MAQSVAHFIGSEEVTGSIPVASFCVKDYEKNSKSEHVMCSFFTFIGKSLICGGSRMDASKTKWEIIASHTFTYFNFLNLVLAALIVFSGQQKNMLFMGIVITNALIGIIQELKVKKLIDALSVVTATKAKLLAPAGEEREVPVEQLRIGDVVRFSIGDQIPVDCELSLIHI